MVCGETAMGYGEMVLGVRNNQGWEETPLGRNVLLPQKKKKKKKKKL